MIDTSLAILGTTPATINKTITAKTKPFLYKAGVIFVSPHMCNRLAWLKFYCMDKYCNNKFTISAYYKEKTVHSLPSMVYHMVFVRDVDQKQYYHGLQCPGPYIPKGFLGLSKRYCKITR